MKDDWRTNRDIPGGTEPRQCIKCGRWFYDSIHYPDGGAIFYPEGHYGCRWHDCDRINHVTRTEELRSRQTTLLEAIFGRN
jgi:hypothetical protein